MILTWGTDVIPLGTGCFSTKRGFANSYFYKAHYNWNRLPLSLREIVRQRKFKQKLLQSALEEFVTSDSEDGYE